MSLRERTCRTPALVMAAVLTAVVVAACGDGTGPEEKPGIRNDLAFTRQDGTRIEFTSATFVWCGPWEEGQVMVPTLHIVVGGTDRHWHLRTVVDDVVIGTPLSFPNEFIRDQPRNADLFINDPPNELSTQAGASSGQIVFQKLDCRSRGSVEFTIDAVIGSEFGDGPPVTVDGSFRAPLTPTG